MLAKLAQAQHTWLCVCSGSLWSDRCEFARVPRMLNCMESNAAEMAKFHVANWSPSQQKILPTYNKSCW